MVGLEKANWYHLTDGWPGGMPFCRIDCVEDYNYSDLQSSRLTSSKELEK